MSSKHVARDSRRSTRVPLKIIIEAKGLNEPLTCEGQTIVVNLHGALISTSVCLKIGMSIAIEVVITGKCAPAKVVYVDPEKPEQCGIALAKPENVWGLSFPPDDWHEGHEEP